MKKLLRFAKPMALVTIIALVALLTAVTATAASGTVYFDPATCGAAYSNTVDVELRVDAANFQSGQVELTYDTGCCEVTNFVRNTGDFAMGGWESTDGREWITFTNVVGPLTGDYLIGTLTVQCLNAGECTTGLVIANDESELFNDQGGELADVDWMNGDFSCENGGVSNDVYFDPATCGAAYSNTVDVELRVDAANFQSGQVELTYDTGCCEVTNFVRNTGDFAMGGWESTDGREWITFTNVVGPLTGDYLIGTLTVQCLNAGECTTGLVIANDESELFNDQGGELATVWMNGAFTCSSQSTYYADVDNDGYGDPNDSVVADSAPTGYVSDNTDCDDTNAAVNPGATEIWNDGIDNDCDGYTDCDDSDCLVDADGDGYNAVPCGDDCDDTNAAVNPGATEVQNGIDDNCNGQIDEGFCECDFCMPLEAGLNLVSVPRCVEVGGSSMALAVFNLSGIETCDSWDGCTGEWSDDLPNAMQVLPARAYFVYKVNAEMICMNGTTYVDTQTLCIDTWAMVGFPSLDPMTVTEFRAASNLNDKFLTAWQWNGGWYPMTGNSNMEPYHGYVLWMTDNGVMPGMIA